MKLGNAGMTLERCTNVACVDGKRGSGNCGGACHQGRAAVSPERTALGGQAEAS
ncbi:MAG: hypothetical protein R3B70_23740 [Polyangiaceae bacterium]